ncbi:MAG: spore germination protein [Oscillospiraceae bacterium]|nr:spore germination protein [Oscillospiraceae bacterium]
MAETQAPPNTTCDANVPEESRRLRPTIQENKAILDELFTDVDIMLHREFENAECPGLKFCIYFSDGVSDSMMLGEHVIKPLILADNLPHPPKLLYEAVRDHVELTGEISETQDVQEIVNAITYGDTLLLVEGSATGLIINNKGFQLRGIAEPEGEKVLLGPREGFTEGLMTNLSMLRRRLRTHQLKLKMDSLGRQSKTGICIAYMDNIVNKDILKELERRLEGIDIDAVLDAGYITEFIAEKSVLGFHTIGSTERPDVVAGRLLEGRIAIFTDGSPVVLTLPYLFVENFQSSEDYYMGNLYASYNRMLRILSFICTITIPAAFVAVLGFHHELLPTGLMLTFSAARQNVPLPTALECLLLLLFFDFLREAGVRTPGYVGQAVGFVGGVVIGQAAVEANLVAAPVVIVVAFTGITIIVVPRLTMASLFARYGLLLAASLFGLVGLALGLAIVLVHVINLQSFGVPTLMPTGKLDVQTVKDTFVRIPWPRVLTRIPQLSDNRVRSKPGGERE